MMKELMLIIAGLMACALLMLLVTQISVASL
jgi:hypothetical protein